MDILRFGIILLILMGLVPVASATHTHEITGTFVNGDSVQDEVISDQADGYVMRFCWIDPSGQVRSREYVEKLDYPSYINVITGKYVDMEGKWTVYVDEYNRLQQTIPDNPLESSSADFTVAAIPEFSTGSFISLLIAGILYIVMRRTL